MVDTPFKAIDVKVDSFLGVSCWYFIEEPFLFELNLHDYGLGFLCYNK
jgi:hypothetical protein